MTLDKKEASMNNMFLTPSEIRGYLQNDLRVIEAHHPIVSHKMDDKEEFITLKTRKFYDEDDLKTYLFQFGSNVIFYVYAPKDEVGEPLDIDPIESIPPFWKLLRVAPAYHSTVRDITSNDHRKLLDFENKAAEAMDNGVDDERWKPGEDALTALIRERDFYREKCWKSIRSF
jgi:hypothetical protein